MKTLAAQTTRTTRTQHLDRGPAAPDLDGPSDLDAASDLDELFEGSPARSSRTSAAAVTSLFTGVVAVVASPFSLLLGPVVVLAGAALVLAVLGLARASRPGVAGTTLAALGMVLALAAGTVVGLRYLGIDTAVGDAVVPDLRDALAALTRLFPTP